MVESMERMYRGLLEGIRAQPINIPRTAFHFALKVQPFGSFKTDNPRDSFTLEVIHVHIFY